MYNQYDDTGNDSQSDETAKLMAALIKMLGLGPRNDYEDDQNAPASENYHGLNPKDEYFSNILAQNELGQQQQRQQARTNSNPNQQFGEGSNLMDMLRRRESSGNYGAINNLGYTGAYQFGAPALETVGYLRKGAGRQGNRALDNPANWTIPGGKQAFLSNKELQDEAMRKLMQANRSSLERQGIINENTSPQIINAMLSAAHIAGPGGVKALMQGQNRKDAYGTDAQEYYNMGLKAR